ncbi:MAG: hypothetical protein K5756_04555 [Clostridiales bacterium]|nr:hypothetical protein [Clostridiales bacterium]
MKKLKLFNILSIAAFTIMSLSVLLTPFSETYNPLNGKKFMTYIIFALFWLGFVSGIIFVILASFSRKNLKGRKKIKGKLPGIISFFKNTESIISFAVFIIGVAITLFLRIGSHDSKAFLQFIGLFCIVWGFSLHCVFDGCNYRTSKRYKEVEIKEETTK